MLRRWRISLRKWQPPFLPIMKKRMEAAILGLTGDQLNIYSKIITVSDIFDAMTARRPYRSKDTPFKVFELMQHGSFGILDPVVLNTFLKNITNYYIGSTVRLNTGK